MTEILPELYKLSSTGKVQEWNIKCKENHDGTADIIISHGQLGGKIQTTTETILKGKNIGKANETTAWEQALSEAKSKWNRQIDRKGYSEQIPTQKEFRPMLAKKYNTQKSLDDLADGKHISFPAYLQPKLDGIRCTAHYKDGVVDLKSRQGKTFTTLTHIEKALQDLLESNSIILDGELYVHSSNDNFQDIISAVKRDKPNELSCHVEYHIYDIACTKTDYSDRHNKLKDIFKNFNLDNKIKLVESKLIDSHEELTVEYRNYTKSGYEGAMVRNVKGVYKIDGRSKDLQKIKEFIEMEFEIVGAEQNKGKMVNQCTFICKTEDGTEFGVKPKGTEAIREQYWNDWKLGKIKSGDLLTVEFFSWTTSDNPLPRFPVGKTIRNYE